MDLIEQFESLSIQNFLVHDVNIIIYCYRHEYTELLKDSLKIQANIYSSVQELYRQILRILSKKGFYNYLVEMMPYIDDYLEYYSTLS